MAGNWGVNAILGLIAFICTYLFSYLNNTWQTSLFRAGIGLLVFYVLGYIFRFALLQIGSKKNGNYIHKQALDEGIKPQVDQKNEIDEEPIGESSFQSIPLQALHKGEDT
ncbi:hypothetical protein [Neobacillus vireti]|uniref:Uncharacterized protein n=1 Tax=Neobacillus vireti LMG 21834 TaxID=1131730 RepID=A0AB94IQQ8_9BACI|nr:hypothetical protein [Neobacillus vireti]ETI69332.1 hypothetical protein BAVI_07986 [Neobacillus vireti LMG 21834]KLT19838.1 hypothetical protein AA980_04580 [Neobacillus vireti]